jgi:tetratricopeptide (TPR) repeat protein
MRRLLLLSLSLIVLVSPMRTASAAKGCAASETVARANGMYEKGEIARAAFWYRKAFQEDPSCADAYYGLALCRLRQGGMEEAHRLLEKALASSPGHEYAGILLPRVREELERVRAGKERCREHLRNGIRLFRARLYPQALLAFNTALMEDPASAPAHFNLAATHYKLGRYRQAEQEVAQALALDPAHAGARYLSGVLYERGGAGSKALAAFGDLAASDPNNVFAKQALRKLLIPPPQASKGAVYGCVRSVAGFSQGRQEAAGVPPGTHGNNQELTVQLSGGPYGGRASAGFFGAAGLARSRQQGDAVNDTWGNLGFSANPSLTERTSLDGSYDLFLVRREGAVPYRHHQVTLACRFRRLVTDLLQFQGQALHEDFPLARGMDASTFIATALAEKGWGSSASVQASASARWSVSREETYGHRIQGLRLSYRRGGWGSWGMNAGVRHQRADYPRHVEGWRVLGRVDRETGLEVETQIPLMKQLNWIAGDSARWTVSNVPSCTSRSNQCYTGMAWYY